MSQYVGVTKSQALLAALFIGAGLLHFVRPRPYIGIMPPWLAAPALLVFVSGVAEIVGGAGVLFPATRRAAGWWLIVLLFAVYPANIQMLINGYHDDKPVWYIALLWLRLPLQPVLGWWVWRACEVSSLATLARRSG